jgi:nucleoid DNA-binding protein
MTKADLIDELSKVASLTKKQSEAIVDTVFERMTEALAKGEKVEIRGFGSFRIRRRRARRGWNPRTGAIVATTPLTLGWSHLRPYTSDGTQNPSCSPVDLGSFLVPDPRAFCMEAYRHIADPVRDVRVHLITRSAGRAPAGESQADPREDSGGERHPEILVQRPDESSDLLRVHPVAPKQYR